MFISKKELNSILERLRHLEKSVQRLQDYKVDKPIEIARYGLRLDGTPRAKPGRKPKKDT